MVPVGWERLGGHLKEGDLVWVHSIVPHDICTQYPALAVVVGCRAGDDPECVFIDPKSYSRDDGGQWTWYPDTASLVDVDDLTPDQVACVARWRLRAT